MDDKTRTELEAGPFRALVPHLREPTDVQNIGLMNLAGFCRNCLSKWYRAAADEKGVELSDPQAREIVYGMPYDEWRKQYQKEATAEQQAAFAASQPKHARIGEGERCLTLGGLPAGGCARSSSGSSGPERKNARAAPACQRVS